MIYMPITIDGLLFGNWEYQYKKKDPEIDENGNTHYWYAMGHDKESFDAGLVMIEAYEEYYGHRYKLEPRPLEEAIFPDRRTVNVKPVYDFKFTFEV